MKVERLIRIAGRLLHTDRQYDVDYEYDQDISSLRFHITDQYFKICKEKLFRIQQFSNLARKGKEISANDLYYDKKRAEEQFGFCQNLYFPRESVDGKINDAIELKTKIIVIKGIPGSGKTRAMYECIRTMLANENIIILNPENVEDVTDRMDIFDEKKNAEEETYYLVCDQIKDVFFQMDEKKVDRFFKTIINNSKLYFLTSSINSSYNVFLDNFSKLKEWFDDTFITKEVDIPVISKDKDADNIRIWLANNFPTQKGETIGDYIPGLNNYIEQIVNSLYIKTKEVAFGRYIASFLKASQVNSLFRRTSPLFIPIMIMRKEYEKKDEDQFKQECINCINYLIDKNCIWVRKGNTSIRLSEKSFDFEESNEYDGEEMLSIIPIEYTYSLNELVWEAILKKENEKKLQDKEYLFSYFMDNEDDTIVAVKSFYNTFPTSESLRRILPRIPQSSNYEQCMEVVWEYVHKKIKSFAKKTPKSESVILTYSMLIGRANNWEKAQEILQEMEECGIEPNGNTIGELYRFASFHLSNKTILSFIENLQTKHEIPDDLYILFRKMQLRTHTFQEGVDFLTKHELTKKIGPYAEDIGSLEYINAQKIFRHLSKCIENYDDWRIMLQLYDEASLEMDNITLYSFVHSAWHNTRQLKEICELFLANDSTLQADIRNKRYELLIAYLIMHSPDFETSIYFYNLNYERIHKDNFRLLALSFKNCNKTEYQKAVHCIDQIEDRVKEKYPETSISPILYNEILGIAPTQDDASYFFDRINRVDGFTLCNLLKDILRASNADEKRFIYAYELINRPLFRPLRDDIHVVAILFNLTTHPGHEEYIFSMINQDLNGGHEAKALINIIETSDEITSIRIRKPYRSLQDAYNLFLLTRKRHLNYQSIIKSDIYNAISNRINFEKENPELKDEYRQKWLKVVQEDDDILLKDEHFYSTVYRFYKLDSVVQEGKVSSEFQTVMESVKAIRNKTFNNILLALKFAYDFDTMKILYEYYIRWFIRSGKPELLAPDHRTYTYLLEAARTKEEALFVNYELIKYHIPRSRKLFDTIRTAENKFSINFERYKQEKSNTYLKQGKENPLLIHDKLRDGGLSTEKILQILEEEYIVVYNFVTPSILNSAITGIFKEANRSKSNRYELLMKFINQYNLSKSFTQYTYLYLIKLSPNFAEVLNWLTMTDSSVSEVLYGSLACNFKIAQNDININRKYFNRWENIYKELYFEYGLESCWETMGIYLRIEAESMNSDMETAIPILCRLIETFYNNKRKFRPDTFGNTSFDYVINQIIIRTGDVKKWEEIRAFYE